MLKRIALSLTFVAALITAGFTFATPAQAWRSYGRPYASRYYGPRAAYYAPYRPYRSYRTYYGSGGPYVVAPRVYRPYYDSYYYGPPVYYSSPGVSVSFGF